jgi:hypothetical protein
VVSAEKAVFFQLPYSLFPSLLNHKYGSLSSCATIDIPASLYQRLKARAANQGSSSKRLILRGVEQVLGEKRTVSSRKRMKLRGTVRLDNARIYDIISFP